MPDERTVSSGGTTVRYLVAGEGPSIICLHGGALGASADVWERSLDEFAEYGFTAVAMDQPGVGGTGIPKNYGFSEPERRQFIWDFADALEIERFGIVGHSQSGRPAVNIGSDQPSRIFGVVILGTGSLLPPLDSENQSNERAIAVAQEPTLEETYATLRAQVYDPAAVTNTMAETWHRFSIGPHYENFLKRLETLQAHPRRDEPLWDRLEQLSVPLLMMYGELDRGRAAERVALAKRKYSKLDIRLVKNSKHIVQWDNPTCFVEAASRFFLQHMGSPEKTR